MKFLFVLSYLVFFLLALSLELSLTGEPIANWTTYLKSKLTWIPDKFWNFNEKLNSATGVCAVYTMKPTLGGILRAVGTVAFTLLVRLLAVPLAESGGKLLPMAIACILTTCMVLLSINLTIRFCNPYKGGESLFELFLTGVLLLIFKGVTRTIASALAVAFAGHDFIVSLLRNGPAILLIVLLVVILIRFIYVGIAYKNWLKALCWILIVVVILLGIFGLFLCLKSLKWPTKDNSGDSGTTTTATTTTATTTVATTETTTPKEESKADPKKEEKPKEEPECGPDYGVAENGVTYDYTEYNDRYIVNGKNVTAKTSWNAFGLSRATVMGHDDNLKEILDGTKAMPEVLATYAVDFFSDKEKEKLGIKGKTATDIDEMFNGKNGGKLQASIYEAYQEELSSNRVKIEDVTITGWQYSDYIYHIDKNGDGYITPDEAFLCNAKVYRNKTPQVSVKRLINGKWVQVQLLNKNCRYQSNHDIKPNTPKDPSEPELPPPPQKYKKDINDRQPTTVNQPNEDPNSKGDNTNTGVGSTVSSQEPGTKPGDASGSANFENPNDYIEYNQNELKEQQEQLEKNGETEKSVGTPPGSVEPEEKKEDGTPPGSVEPEEKVETIFNDGEEASEKPTEKTPSKITVNGGEDINKKGASNGVVTGP